MTVSLAWCQGWGQIRFIKYKYKYKYKNLDFSNTNTNILLNFDSNTNTNTSIQIQIQIRSTKYICETVRIQNRAILKYKFTSKVPIDNIPFIGSGNGWQQTDDKPLPEPKMYFWACRSKTVQSQCPLSSDHMLWAHKGVNVCACVTF